MIFYCLNESVVLLTLTFSVSTSTMSVGFKMVKYEIRAIFGILWLAYRSAKLSAVGRRDLVRGNIPF